MHKITEFVKDPNNMARFDSYRAGVLYYVVRQTGTDALFRFPIDAADLQQATISREEKAITLMRYIRKALEEQTLVRAQ